jgi:allose kinase
VRDIFLEKDVIDELSKEISSVDGTVRSCLAGISIGLPGTVSKDKRFSVSCPNLRCFDGLNVAEALEERFGIPVRIEHDITALFANDMNILGLYDLACVIGIYAGTGIGNAIYANGAFIGGANGASGELGHIPISGNQKKCDCGNEGCIETIASGKILKRLYDEKYSDELFEDFFSLHADEADASEFVDNLSLPVATEINILDPDAVVVGGGILNMRDFPFEMLKERIIAHTLKPLPGENVKILRGIEDPYSGVRGLGFLFWNYLRQHMERRAIPNFM